MSGRGLHIALTDAELDELRSLPADEQADHIGNVLEEEKCGSPDACETDKSWAYMQAAFTDSDPDGPIGIPGAAESTIRSNFLSRLFGNKAPPSSAPGEEAYAIMGKMAILEGADYFIGWVPSDAVKAVADALQAIPTDTLGLRVQEVHRRFGASGDSTDAADYAMGWYPDLVAFYARAAEARKHVIFTVDF